MKANKIHWYHEIKLLNCDECERKDLCTIADLKECAKSFEEWLEENAI